jgi:POT family proton-dependent oligopeptide transporter
MSEKESKDPIIKNIVKELTQPFVDVFHASRALWGVNLSYVLEGLTYFGVVGYLVISRTS